MKVHLPVIPAQSARRLLLGAQGLLSDPQRRVTPIALQKLIEGMGFVQLDSINVVERAHHLTLATRIDGYQHAHLAHLLENERSLFEHWTHDASAIPARWFHHWKPRFARNRERIRGNTWWRERVGENPEKVLNDVRERIRHEGPLRSQDFEHDRKGETAGWWEWKPQKAALEHLWQTGELSVVRRLNFQKVYDLTERVLPEQHLLPEPSEAEHIEWACRTALERLVIATPKEIADFWQSIPIAQAKRWCEAAATKFDLVPVLVQGLRGSNSRSAYALPDWEQRYRKLPEPPERMRLLCPFDPVLRDRARSARLFGFEYRFEAFVPEQKRQYGYYVLPILEEDKLVGRVDPKFHRQRGVLEIRRIYWEPHVKPTAMRRRRLTEATERLARTIGAEHIELPVAN